MLETADYDLRTVLHLASSEGHLDCVKWLLKENVDKNVKDCFGNRPIEDAIRYNHPDIIRLLCDSPK